jgi:hypothetical protein
VALTIDYRLTGTGWAGCTVRADGRDYELSASHLSDALGKLVLAAAAILAGAHSISVGFDEEPGEYRWSIVQTGHGTGRLTIRSFQDLWGNRPDIDGALLLSVTCAPLEFAEAVRDAAEAVLKRHGPAGYKNQWQYDFPLRELDLLRSYVADWERNQA